LYYTRQMTSVTLKELVDSSVLAIGEEITFKGHNASKKQEPFIFPPAKARKRRRNPSHTKSKENTVFSNFIETINKNEIANTAQDKSSPPLPEDPSSTDSCGDIKCIVCKWGPPGYFINEVPTWSDILQVVLYALKVSHPDKEYFSLREDIYEYLDKHWNKLCGKTRNATWRQTAKMTLAHSRYHTIFENGYKAYLRTGFWRLKAPINPYVAATEMAHVPAKRKETTQAHKDSYTPYNLRKREDHPNYVESSDGSDQEELEESNDKLPRKTRQTFKRRRIFTPSNETQPSQNHCNSCDQKSHPGKSKKFQAMDVDATENNSSDENDNLLKKADLPMEYIFRDVTPLFPLSHQETAKLVKETINEDKEITKLREENEKISAQLQEERVGRLKDQQTLFEMNQEVIYLSKELEQLLKQLHYMEFICDNSTKESNHLDNKYQKARNKVEQLRQQLTNLSRDEMPPRELQNYDFAQFITDQPKASQYHLDPNANKQDIPPLEAVKSVTPDFMIFSKNKINN